MISRKAIREFAALHPDALPSLSNWYGTVRRAVWKNLTQLKADFARPDQFERRTIFNIGGGKYRLIARINYTSQRVFILFILKHSEYTKDRWKSNGYKDNESNRKNPKTTEFTTLRGSVS